MLKKKTIGISIFVICIICLTPLAFEYLIFRNNIYSVLDNNGWGGFLGSYIGGLLGGVGTLLAVYITTQETRKIQTDNTTQLEKEKALNSKKERKQFTDGVAQDIAKYITSISNYFYDNRKLVRLDKDMSHLNDKLKGIETKIQHQLNIQKGMNVEKEIADYTCVEGEIKLLQERERVVKYEIEQVSKAIKTNKADRTIANECYFLLKIKLQDIKIAEELIKQLKYVHDNSGNVEGTKYEFIDIETTKLLNMTVLFTDRYVNQKLF